MSCTHISERIPLFISRDLDESEMESVGQHLLSCEPCRSLESQYREADSWLKSLSDVEPEIATDGELRTRVNRVIDTDESKRLGWQTVVVAGAIAAALLITSAFALTMYRRGDQRGEDSIAVTTTATTGTTAKTATTAKTSGRKARVRIASQIKPGNRSAVPPCPLTETASHTPMRIEIQTSDPNIRIIWLTSDHGGIE